MIVVRSMLIFRKIEMTAAGLGDARVWIIGDVYYQYSFEKQKLAIQLLRSKTNEGKVPYTPSKLTPVWKCFRG